MCGALAICVVPVPVGGGATRTYLVKLHVYLLYFTGLVRLRRLARSKGNWDHEAVFDIYSLGARLSGAWARSVEPVTSGR